VDRTGTPDGCWPFTGGLNHGGYGQLSVGRLHWIAHRLAYTLTYGPIPEGLLVLHACDSPPCCRPDHLWLGTHAVNSEDMAQKGRSLAGDRNPTRLQPDRVARGDRVWTTRLNPDQVREIRSRRAAGWSQADLVEAFGVCQGTISQVVRRVTWKHID
jgi:hypothetical protein